MPTPRDTAREAVLQRFNELSTHLDRFGENTNDSWGRVLRSDKRVGAGVLFFSSKMREFFGRPQQVTVAALREAGVTLVQTRNITRGWKIALSCVKPLVRGADPRQVLLFDCLEAVQ